MSNPTGKKLEKMYNSEKAFDLQEKIANLIDKLNELGFEYMYYNNISSIRRKRK
jgi:translation initiation factor IF-2